MTEIYFDNSTIARPSQKAAEKMLPYLSETWGALAAPHQIGQSFTEEARRYVEKIYHLIGASDQDSFFLTSSGAEANQMAIFSGYEDVMLQSGKNQFLTSTIEGASIYLSLERLQKFGAVLQHVPVDSKGQVTVEALSDCITPRTAQLSLSWADGWTGVIQPVEEISELCKERGIRFHLDVTQALGKLHFDLEDLGADLITWNGLPLHAPIPCGGVWAREGVLCSPLIMENTKELNIFGLIALGYTIEEAFECLDLMGTEVSALRQELEEKILKECSEAVVLFSEQERLPHCTTIAFRGVAAEALLYRLNQEGVYASVGGGASQQLSCALPQVGIEDALAHSAISFSLSRETTKEQVSQGSKRIIEAVRELRVASDHMIGREPLCH